MATSTAPTINTYISDMLALEQHIETPLQAQINDADVQAAPAAIRVIRETYDTVLARITALEARLDAVGGHAASPIKNAVTSLFGAAAAVIDKARKTEVSKALRDDYTALCLASAGYTMLHTTALGLGDHATATLAENHLSGVATQIMKINKVIPAIVLGELSEMGVSVDPTVAATAEKDSEEAWSKGAAASAS